MEPLDAEARRRLLRLRTAPRDVPSALDAPGASQESVWDYPRPPRLEPERRRLQVSFGGSLVADSVRAVRVLETSSPPTLYVPPSDVRTEHLHQVAGSSLCEWKGEAQYWDLRVAGAHAIRAAWSYPKPFPEFLELTDWLAFFPGRVDVCSLGDERVTPQPGDFYGGWITSEIVGPFKGDPGTEGW